VVFELWKARRKEKAGETVEGRDTDYDEPVERAAVEREVFGHAATAPVAGQAGTEVVDDGATEHTER